MQSFKEVNNNINEKLVTDQSYHENENGIDESKQAASLTKNKWFNYARTVVFLTGTFGGSIMGSIVETLPLWPLLFLGQVRLAFRLVNGSRSFFLTYVQALSELLLNIQLVITGDQLCPNESSLMLMNHRTRLDWVYFFGVPARQSRLRDNKVILRSILKQVPGVGWGMQICAYLFIKRHLENDKKAILKMMRYYKDLQEKPQLLLYPEGTDLTPHTKSVSDRFARKNGWPLYEHVLHPRTMGFTITVDAMKQYCNLKAVYDITVAYPFNKPQQEVDLIKGEFPREVHFHIKRYPIETLPTSEEGLADWCRERWVEKEARLREFSRDGHFDQSRVYQTTTQTRVKLWAALILKTIVMLVLGVLIWSFPWLRLAVIVQFVIMVGSSMAGGFDLLQVDIYNKFAKHKD